MVLFSLLGPPIRLGVLLEHEKRPYLARKQNVSPPKKSVSRVSAATHTPVGDTSHFFSLCVPLQQTKGGDTLFCVLCEHRGATGPLCVVFFSPSDHFWCVSPFALFSRGHTPRARYAPPDRDLWHFGGLSGGAKTPMGDTSRRP